jgi:molecular chaperone GrpE
MDDNKEEVKVDAVSVADAETKGDTGETPTEESQNPEIEKLNATIAELNDKYLRAVAEIENTRRRAAIDADAAARNRAMSVARHFLPVIDAMAAALKHNPDDAGAAAMSRAIDAACAEIGMIKIESVGQKLNPQFHNAIQMIDVAGTETNTIVEEMQAGFMFGDTVLRPAMVIVAK